MGSTDQEIAELDSPEWSKELFGGGLRVPAADLEEWVNRVFTVLRDQTGSYGRQVRVESGPNCYRALMPYGGSLTT
jgi:hypothetical protein